MISCIERLYMVKREATVASHKVRALSTPKASPSRVLTQSTSSNLRIVTLSLSEQVLNYHQSWSSMKSQKIQLRLQEQRQIKLIQTSQSLDSKNRLRATWGSLQSQYRTRIEMNHLITSPRLPLWFRLRSNTTISSRRSLWICLNQSDSLLRWPIKEKQIGDLLLPISSAISPFLSQSRVLLSRRNTTLSSLARLCR